MGSGVSFFYRFRLRLELEKATIGDPKTIMKRVLGEGFVMEGDIKGGTVSPERIDKLDPGTYDPLGVPSLCRSKSRQNGHFSSHSPYVVGDHLRLIYLLTPTRVSEYRY